MATPIKRALQAAHLGSAIILGMAISGMNEAPMKVLLISAGAFLFLLWSYNKIYDKPKPTYSDTPIDDAVRRDLGIKD
jgi:hypothetical protein